LIGRAARTAALALFGVALALLSFELVVRLFFPAFEPSGQFRFGYQAAPHLVLGVPGTVARQRKNTGDYDASVRINARGLRDDKDVAEATVGDIAVVGDSFTWGWGVEAEQRFSDQLQSLTGKRVYNLSTPTDLSGYGALLAYARRLGGKFGTVVLAICMENDLGDYGPPAADTNDDDSGTIAGRLRGWLEQSSAAYLFFTTAVHQTPWLEAPAVWLGLIIPNLQGISRNTYSEAVITASARKVAELAGKDRLLAVIIPSRALWVGANRAGEDRVHREFIAALGLHGIDVLDLRPLLEYGGQPLSYHFANDGHWNARGHRLAAEAIARRLAGN
jgi:hypothetical protein